MEQFTWISNFASLPTPMWLTFLLFGIAWAFGGKSS